MLGSAFFGPSRRLLFGLDFVAFGCRSAVVQVFECRSSLRIRIGAAETPSMVHFALCTHSEVPKTRTFSVNIGGIEPCFQILASIRLKMLAFTTRPMVFWEQSAPARLQIEI